MGSFRVRDRASHQVPFARLGLGASTALACISTPIWSRPRYASLPAGRGWPAPDAGGDAPITPLGVGLPPRAQAGEDNCEPSQRGGYRAAAPGRGDPVPAAEGGVSQAVGVSGRYGVPLCTRSGPVTILVKWLRLSFQHSGRYLPLRRQSLAPASWLAPLPMPHRRLLLLIEHVQRLCCAHSRPDRSDP
jgi:hypothetical protein